MSSYRSSEEKGEPHVCRWPLGVRLDQWRPLLDLMGRGPALNPKGKRDVAESTGVALGDVLDLLAEMP